MTCTLIQYKLDKKVMLDSFILAKSNQHQIPLKSLISPQNQVKHKNYTSYIRISSHDISKCQNLLPSLLSFIQDKWLKHPI